MFIPMLTIIKSLSTHLMLFEMIQIEDGEEGRDGEIWS